VAQQLRLLDSALRLRTALARPGRYALSGIVCAIGHNLVLITGDAIGLHYLPATIISFCLIGPLGYWLHVRFTFGAKPAFAAFCRFMAGLSLGFPLSLLIMFLLCDIAGLAVLVAAPITTLALFVWNYLLARWAILRGRRAAVL